MSVSSSRTRFGSGFTTISSTPVCAGELHLINSDGSIDHAARRIYVGHELIIGRDRTKCQWVLDDPQLSAKHLRVYTVVYENEEEEQMEYLVYAEDLSRHGTFWNESLIGKGNGGYLLSQDDKLRLSSKTFFSFMAPHPQPSRDHFDLLQEREMTHFRNEYVVTDRLLGAGTFGQVFMAIEQRTRSQIACKIVDLRKLSHKVSRHFESPLKAAHAGVVDQPAEIQKVKLWAQQRRGDSQLDEQLRAHYREVDILSQLSHPNIISLDKVYVTDCTLYIFQDLITAGDLFSYLESKNGKLLEIEAAVIIRQVLIAVKFLHDQNIIHRDLKPENIMMTSLSAGCRVVLTDFGAARRLDHNHRVTSIIGSEQYAAPEIKQIPRKGVGIKRGYTKAVDMWSIGAITVVLLTGGSAFSDPSTGSYSALLARTCNLHSLKQTSDWAQIRPRPQNFITNLLVLDESLRMTASQALQHSWFSHEIYKTDFEHLYQRTVKDWYPRVAQNPVVEFVKSTFVRYLTCSQAVMRERKRPYQALSPIEPPYKPFPRNMHIQLWPNRRSKTQTFSPEVETAIEKGWKGSIKKAPSHLKSGNTDHRTKFQSNVKIQEESKILQGQSSIFAEASSKLGRTQSLSLRGISTSQPKSVVVEQKNAVASKCDARDTSGEVPNDEISPRDCLSPSTTTSAKFSCQSKPHAALRQSSGQRTSNDGKRAASQKGWRSSMFEILVDEDDLADGSGNIGSFHSMPKRTKLSDTEEPGPDAVVQSDLVVHNTEPSPVTNKTKEGSNKSYLPRV